MFLNNIELKQVYSIKYLGLIFDQHMRWEIHANKTINKLRYLLSIFYKLKQVFRKNTLLKIYYGLFQSRAVYGIIAWGNAYDNVIDKLMNLQNRVLKLILGNSENNSINQPLTIRQYYYAETVNREYFHLQKEFTNKKSSTRHKNISIPLNSLTAGQKSYEYTATKIFNKLPLELRKSKLKKRL